MPGRCNLHGKWCEVPPVRQAQGATPSRSRAVLFSGRPDGAGLPGRLLWQGVILYEGLSTRGDARCRMAHGRHDTSAAPDPPENVVWTSFNIPPKREDERDHLKDAEGWTKPVSNQEYLLYLGAEEPSDMQDEPPNRIQNQQLHLPKIYFDQNISYRRSQIVYSSLL